MGWQPKTLLFFIGLPILGVCAATLYFLHRRDEDWDEFESYLTNRSNVIEVKVPSNIVGSIIGRGGANIKEIQEKTNTKINFKDSSPDDKFRICRIRGGAEAAQLAEAMILESISNQPVIETVEVWVPQKACGRIIGRCGDNIRAISRQSNAQITIDRMSAGAGHKDMKQVLIRGTVEQIAVAKSLIEEKIEEDDIARGKMESTLANRSPRNKPNRNNNKKPEEARRYERLISTDDAMIEVYVSSVANPGHFWVQLINPLAVDLDVLVEHMTDYYNKPENRDVHKLKEVSVGQIVASRFENDDKWYRVEVCSVEDNKEDPEETVVDVYYVDYGDSSFHKIRDLYQLRTDFLQLRFQAIECSMSGIRPNGGVTDWTEESINAFEDMCYSAQWKAMTAQILGYKERERSHREGSPIPCIRLYDPSGQGLDIAKELVDRGYAEFEQKDQPLSEQNQSGGGDMSPSSSSSNSSTSETSSSTSTVVEKKTTNSSGSALATSTPLRASSSGGGVAMAASTTKKSGGSPVTKTDAAGANSSSGTPQKYTIATDVVAEEEEGEVDGTTNGVAAAHDVTPVTPQEKHWHQ